MSNVLLSGANQEIENIKRIMQKVLNFRCKFVIDPSYYEVNEIIEYTAAFLNRRTNSFYCFTFFITGHGDQVRSTTVTIMHV